MMEAGRQRFLATYQEPVRAEDSYGDVYLSTWTNLFNFNISLDTLKAWEIIKAKSVQMNITHRIGCRYSPLINASGRFEYENRIFDIFSVDNVENRNRELEILANEIFKPTGTVDPYGPFPT